MDKHEIRIDFGIRVPMRDDVELIADLYRPTESYDGAQYPVILRRTPYNRNDSNTLDMGRWFAERGYVVAVMDVRGRGDSGGIFEPYRSEGKDGYDTIEWCAAQSWCDGNVGTFGSSYLGHSQWLAALEKPPHLITMIAMVTPSDPFVEWPLGSQSPMHLCWLHLTSGRTNQRMDAINWEEVYLHLPLLTMDEAAGRFNPTWRDELLHPRLDEYWEPLRYQHRLHEIDLPVMHISGWYDDEQVGTPFNFARMSQEALSHHARHNQKLIMGPWGHAINTTQKLGEVDFGPQSLIDLRALQLDWFDRWLKRLPGKQDDSTSVKIFVMGKNEWRDEQEWPLSRTDWTRYYLHSGGRANSRFGDGWLASTRPGHEQPDEFFYDPERPTPFITEPTSSQIGGPDDYASIQRRDDLLVYITLPIDNEIEITGPIKLELFASSSAPDTDFTALLFDLHPSGFAQRLCDGIVRARFRNGMDNPTLIEPGKIYAYEIDLWNTSQVFFKGHRIGIQLASCAFPKYDRNLNTGQDLATSVCLQKARQTIFHDAEHPSALVLPVVPPPNI